MNEIILYERVEVKPTRQLLPFELLRVYELVKNGGAVDRDGLFERIQKTEYVSNLIAGGRIVSTVSIKLPDYERRKNALGYFGKCPCCREEYQKYRKEFGYGATDREFKGKGCWKRVIEAILPLVNEPMFATTRSDKVVRMLESVGFVKTDKHRALNLLLYK